MILEIEVVGHLCRQVQRQNNNRAAKTDFTYCIMAAHRSGMKPIDIRVGRDAASRK